jgi:hypothetical protein
MTIKRVVARLQEQAVTPEKKPAHIEVRKMTKAEKKAEAKVLDTTLAVIVDRRPQGIKGDNYQYLSLTASEAAQIGKDLVALSRQTDNANLGQS